MPIKNIIKNNLFDYSQLNVDQLAADFEVQINKGLSQAEAEKRMDNYGPNEVAAKEIMWWHILFNQFKSSFIYLLFGAAFLAFILGEFLNGATIVLFLMINTALGFYQEFRSEQTLKLIKQYAPHFAKVIRQGREVNVAVKDLVPGDVVILETGDIVPADVRFTAAHDLTVNESILTGESVAVKKTHERLAQKPSEYYQAVNLGLAGTTVVNGKATGVVIKTGRESALGSIAKLTMETVHVSSFVKGINRFSKFIIYLVTFTLVFIVVMNFLIKAGQVDAIGLLIFAIALAVSVIPEALPAVTTFSLARGALRMAKKKVVVKRLSAIEDLGGISILCTDKTGTLTENKLKVSELFGENKNEVLIYANLGNSSGQAKKLEPFDIALMKKLNRAEKNEIKKYDRLDELPFDPARRRNSVLVRQGGDYELIVRGAPEVILNICHNLPPAKKDEISQWVAQRGRLGMRTLAVAKKKVSSHLPSKDDGVFGQQEKELEFLGVVAFIDPIKETTGEAIEQAEKLGVQIKILTGDSPEVAGAVAFKLGLIKQPEQVVSGEKFECLNAKKQRELINQTTVFARVSPEQKFKIIELLEEQNEIGFLGEGINDAPALKISSVSLVVQGAADIARDAADIVLLQKSLKVIVDGIKEGRSVFANTIKYIKATMASNFGNFYAMAVASLFINYLPMLPLQILLLNLLSDFPMISIATDSVDDTEIAEPRRYDIRDIVIIATFLGIVSTIFDFMFFGLFYRISPGVLQTNWFLASVLTELAFLFSIRSRKFFLRSKRPSWPVLGLTAVGLITALILPYTILGQRLFDFVPPTSSHLTIILLVVAIYFVVTETVKLLYYKYFVNIKLR